MRHLIILFACLLGFLPARETLGADPGVRLTVTARVLSYFRVRPEYQQAGLSISRQDLERGYVDAPSASRFSVSTNTRHGYVVEVLPVGDIAREVQIHGPGGSTRLGAEGGTLLLPAPPRRDTPQELTYRFILRADLQPGYYAWPLALAARPL